MRKLYLFVNNADNQQGWNDCLSITDDGYVLGNHICSHMGYMQHDLHDRPDRLEKIKSHFGDKPYEVEILSYEDCKTHTGLNAAVALAQGRKQDYVKAGAVIELAGDE